MGLRSVVQNMVLGVTEDLYIPLPIQDVAGFLGPTDFWIKAPHVRQKDDPEELHRAFDVRIGPSCRRNWREDREVWLTTITLDNPTDPQYNRHCAVELEVVLIERGGYPDIHEYRGVYTYLFDARGRMVPSIRAPKGSQVWILFLGYDGDKFTDGTMSRYPKTGLWFREGTCPFFLPEIWLWNAKTRLGMSEF
jgi:hypothetical protein